MASTWRANSPEATSGSTFSRPVTRLVEGTVQWQAALFRRILEVAILAYAAELGKPPDLTDGGRRWKTVSMNLVEFLESRIAEEEAGLQGRDFIGAHKVAPVVGDDMEVPPSLTEAIMAECKQKRQILADWAVVAEAEGITDPADAEGTVALARRSMLSILAAGYKDHPDYQAAWSLRTDDERLP